jgi:4'-phosphopantetheinyl transferase
MKMDWVDVQCPEEAVTWQLLKSGREAHVWQASARLHSNSFYLLSAEEKERALNYKFARDREQYIGAHAILRRLLASYTGVPLSELRYEYGKFGKPCLAIEPEIHFNMTRDGDTVLIVVSNRYEAGIDLEKVKLDFDWRNIANQYFSSTERFFIDSLPQDQKTNAFFYIWTRKEAMLKALGVGLSGLATMGESVIDCVNGKHALVSFKFEDFYQCSLAISANLSRIRYFRFRG